MGIYLNPSNAMMKKLLNSKIYIDKSPLLRELNSLVNTGDCFVCVSRPRRFGKTMASAMIAAYYSKGCDSSDIFAKLKISSDKSFKEHLNKYNVIQFDINTFYKRTNGGIDLIDNITSTIVAELLEEFPQAKIQADDTLENAIIKAWSATGEAFIIIMDEYDVLVREKVSQDLFDKYLNFLSSLFKNSTLKPAIALAYLTGILPIVRDKIQSKMNEFDEYSMLNARQFSEFTGFTEDEVKALCSEYNMDYQECRRWYDGYKMNDSISVYSPKSMVTAMQTGEYGNYWTTIGIAYFYANSKYTIIKELPSGKGYADLALIPYVPNLPAVIIELKNNKSPDSAINQIIEKKYDDILQHYRGNLLFVGINYSPETKEHQCKIERFVI